ncbi:DUF58 domain-containing protein [Trichocoleus desertorum AS-A10]|uniref:DUF58 domain-containing protein n=1 Tax=Trichocoleus desertorum TaxID=1481672 RepID=UPI00329A7BA0
MNLGKRIADWLETHWVTPSYSGWLLAGLAIFFFAAGTNTLSGWLYVMSGVIVALLGVAAILPERSLRGIQVTRRPINPVSVGSDLTIELDLENRTAQAKTLLQVRDLLPYRLAKPAATVVEAIPPRKTYRWTYFQPTEKRGVYRWHNLQLRTAAPLGLFWCRRERTVKAAAIVYPTVLPLTACPLIDEIGRENSPKFHSSRRSQNATEGITRALRPYRWGDPIRLIHWRTSARYGEFRVRELEVFTGGEEIVICLDSAGAWQADDFEQAVIAAASLYFYMAHRDTHVKLWTAGTGLLQGDRSVLEALAGTYAGEEVRAESLPELPMVWLTQNPQSLNTLPLGSRWLLWPPTNQKPRLVATSDLEFPGLVIQLDKSLQTQLQSQLQRLYSESKSQEPGPEVRS